MNPFSETKFHAIEGPEAIKIAEKSLGWHFASFWKTCKDSGIGIKSATVSPMSETGHIRYISIIITGDGLTLPIYLMEVAGHCWLDGETMPELMASVARIFFNPEYDEPR